MCNWLFLELKLSYSKYVFFFFFSNADLKHVVRLQSPSLVGLLPMQWFRRLGKTDLILGAAPQGITCPPSLIPFMNLDEIMSVCVRCVWIYRTRLGEAHDQCSTLEELEVIS